jgi:hypothetical protein
LQRKSWDSKCWHLTQRQRELLKTGETYITALNNRTNQPDNPEVETEELVDSGNRDPYIWNSDVEKVIKEMWDKKPTGGNGVPEDVLILLGEGY